MDDVPRSERADSGPVSDEGDRVKRRRERIGYDKKRLAEEAGVSRDTLFAIEEGKGFRRDSLTKLERRLGEVEEELGITDPLPDLAEQVAHRSLVINLENGAVVLDATGYDSETIVALAQALLRTVHREAEQAGPTDDQ